MLRLGLSAYATMATCACTRVLAQQQSNLPKINATVHVTLTPAPDAVSAHERCGGTTADACLATGVSGMRFHDKKLWIVTELEGAWLASTSWPAEKSDARQLAVRAEVPHSGGGLCQGLTNVEALTFQEDGSLVVATDSWVVATVEPGTLKVKDCWRDPEWSEETVKANVGFEAVFVHKKVVYAVGEHAWAGRYKLVSKTAAAKPALQSVAWKQIEGCKSPQRITDAVEVSDGALLLASCRADTWRYFLARLTLDGEQLAIAHVAEIHGNSELSLEGITKHELDYYVINDGHIDGKYKHATKLWKLERAQVESTMKLPSK